MDDLKALTRKIDALAIILSAPLWPKRENLSEAGKLLFDRMLADAKPFSLHVADIEFADALAIAAGWTPLLTEFIETAHINSPDTLTRITNRRMLAVYRHYIDATGVKFSAIV
jgi:hypothetical protein